MAFYDYSTDPNNGAYGTPSNQYDVPDPYSPYPGTQYQYSTPQQNQQSSGYYNGNGTYDYGAIARNAGTGSTTSYSESMRERQQRLQDEASRQRFAEMDKHFNDFANSLNKNRSSGSRSSGGGFRPGVAGRMTLPQKSNSSLLDKLKNSLSTSPYQIQLDENKQSYQEKLDQQAQELLNKELQMKAYNDWVKAMSAYNENMNRYGSLQNARERSGKLGGMLHGSGYKQSGSDFREPVKPKSFDELSKIFGLNNG